MATNFERRRLGKKTNPEYSGIRNIGGVKKRFRTTATIPDRFQTELWKKKKKKRRKLKRSKPNGLNIDFSQSVFGSARTRCRQLLTTARHYTHEAAVLPADGGDDPVVVR